MTEYEILDLMASVEAQMASQFTLYLTVISAYLVVAYFVGNKLTLPQTLIASILFMFGAGGQVWGLHKAGTRVAEYLDKKAQLSPLSPYEQQFSPNVHGWVIVMVLGVIASLYFMWSVRYPKTE